MLRYASSFAIAAYVYVRLTLQDSRALPAELFTKPSNLANFSTFYESVKYNPLGFFILKSTKNQVKFLKSIHFF